MRSLNLDQLRTLVEVVEQGSFSGAARQLNLTQPAISLHIRALEQRFNVRLVERFGRQAYATAPGQTLIDHANRIFAECDLAVSAMQRYRDGWIGRVHIGTTLTALRYQLPSVLKQLRTDHPGIDLSVTNMPTRDTVRRVLDNKADFGLVTLPVKDPQLRVTPLNRETLVAILPAGTNDVPDVVTPEYMARQLLILEHDRGAVHALVMQWLSRAMPLRHVPMRLGTVEAMKTAVGSGLGMSLIPDGAVQDLSPDVITRPLKPAVPCPLALIEHIGKPSEPAFDIVREALLGIRSSAKSGIQVKGRPKRRVAA